MKILQILKKNLPQTIERGYLDFDNAYELFAGVILSAQSTDKKVNQIRPFFVQKYPDFFSLSMAVPSELEEVIYQAGFFRMKAMHLISSAKIIVDKWNGELPGQMEELLQLPGIGRKSAGVLMARLWGRGAIIVDTHFLRVNNRLGISDTTNPLLMEKQIAKKLKEEFWTDYSMYINAHGRLFCDAKKPRCALCPLNKICPSNFLSKKKAVPDLGTASVPEIRHQKSDDKVNPEIDENR